MLDTLNKPFVTVLRAKGLPENKIIYGHVLRNSAIPMVTVFLPMFIGTATGSIFVEAMFRVPLKFRFTFEPAVALMLKAPLPRASLCLHSKVAAVTLVGPT